MAHSFSQLLRRVDSLWQRFVPSLYYFIYWFGFPAVMLYGKQTNFYSYDLSLTYLSYGARYLFAR